ncbi:MAG: MBL fold metallo-hydrolase [Dehalococcoidia bacterium]
MSAHPQRQVTSDHQTRQWPTGTQELAPGVFAYLQSGGGLCVSNAGLIATPAGAAAEGATAVDALFTPPMTRAFLDEARRLTGRPVARLLNTHHHVDHTLGNAAFPAATQIVAHAKAKAEMQRSGLGVLDVIARIAPHFAADLRDARQRLPDLTFDGDALELDAGGRRLRLLHLGPAHTVGDVLVHLPEERILFAGDLAFFYVTPLAHEGHIGNWVRVGHRIIDEVDADVIVPGHGPVGTKVDLRLMLGYFELLRDAGRPAFDAGASEQEAVRSILGRADIGPYAAWTEPERIAPNVARLYREFRGELDALIEDSAPSPLPFREGAGG